MELPQSANPLTEPQSRLTQVDALRGLALLGIGVTNLFAIHTPSQNLAQYAAQFPNGLDHWVLMGGMVLVRGKFYPLFALVFGVAAAYSLPRSGSSYFLRRLAALFGLGLLQVLFVWNGDVLIQYAAMGLLLLALRNFPVKVLLGIGALLFLFSFVGNGWVAGGPVMAEAANNGGFWQAVKDRARVYSQNVFTWQALLFYAKIFGFMLLGFALAKAKALPKLSQRCLALKAFGLHALLVLAVGLFLALAGWREEENLPYWSAWVKPVLLALFFYGLVASYALVPFVLREKLSGLKWLGRLTLTHYMVQNLVFSLLIFGYGLGLAGSLAPRQLLLIFLAVLAVQWAVSKPLLQKFKAGPFETLVRKLAGRK